MVIAMVMGMGETKRQEKVGVVKAKDKVGVVKAKDKVGVVKAKDKVGVVKAKDKVGPAVVKAKDKVGVVKAKDKVGPAVVKAKDKVGPAVVKDKKKVGPAVVKDKKKVGQRKRGGSTNTEPSGEIDRLKRGQQIAKLENQVERLLKSRNDEIDKMDTMKNNNYGGFYDEKIVISDKHLGEYFSARREIEDEIKLLKNQV
jgi:hypothetical protein